MIKFFTLFNTIGLILFNALFGGDVTIVQDMPAHLDPGSEVRVNVTITKDNISGFAKLQIDLPPGLSATAIETKGASFTFADGKAKFIWMALPSQPSFKVSYTLSAASDANGTLPVTAHLSYIQDNERKVVEMAPATITLGNSSTVAATPAPAPTVAEPAADATTTVEPSVEAAIPATQGPGEVSGFRTITPVSATEMLVSVTLHKGALRGFGKLQETLPEGFSAIAKETDDAIFSASSNVVKFVWLNLPSKQDLTVSYRLLAPAATEGEYAVNGEFGYLLNDLTQKVVIGSTSFLTGAAALASIPKADTTPATQTTAAPATAETATPEQVAQTATSAQPATTQEKGTSPTTATASQPKATSTPAPETGITYKVQITAAHREVGKPYFVKRHNYHGDFSIEHNEGWIKYVTGMFNRYKAARDQRQAYLDANYNFPGPFVTAYNGGERITVQEALMISGQRSTP